MPVIVDRVGGLEVRLSGFVRPLWPDRISNANALAQSPFLDLLFKYQCIRTQKKQKVFYW